MDNTDTVHKQLELNALIEFAQLISSKLDLKYILNNILLSNMGKMLISKGMILLKSDDNNENNVKNSGGEKIKTYLTVDQLAFLFKAMVENHIIDKRISASLFRVISRSFESKAQDDVSVGSIDKFYATPTEKALDFWIDNFDRMQKIAIRMKQKKDT